MTVVLASAGYPASSSKGDVITGLEEAAAIEGVEVTHAGTALNDDGEIVTAGGRVLNVTGLGPSPADARRRAYDAAERIELRRQADANRHRGPRGRARAADRAVTPNRKTMETDRDAAAPSPAPDAPTPRPMPEVEEAFEEIEVDAPLVGIIMGSKNDKPKMQPAGKALHEAGISLRGPRAERPPPARGDRRVLRQRPHARA